MKTEELKRFEKTGSLAVRNLRLQKLGSGMPFMINSRELPKGQCYLEYPGGRIKLAKLSDSYRNLDIIRDLSEAETNQLRLRYHLQKL